MKKTIVLLIVIACIAYMGCKPMEPEEPEPDSTTILTPCEKPHYEQLLAGNLWALTSYIVNGVEEIGSLDSCQRDDQYSFIFNSNPLDSIETTGKFYHNNGATRCNPNDAQIIEVADWEWHSAGGVGNPKGANKMVLNSINYQIDFNCDSTAYTMKLTDSAKNIIYTYTGNQF